MRYSVSRYDQLRLSRLQQQFGVAPDRNVLWIADGVRLNGRYPGRLISDAMVAVWLREPSLQARFADLAVAETQRAYLAWYCCDRLPAASDAAGQHTIDATLAALAGTRLGASGFPGLPLTGLIDMAAARHFGGGAAPRLRGQMLSDNLIAWFYSRGAVEAGVFHHVSRQEHAVIQAPYSYQGQMLWSLAALWALEHDGGGHPLDLSTAERQRDAALRVTDAMRRHPGLAVYADAAERQRSTPAATQARPPPAAGTPTVVPLSSRLSQARGSRARHQLAAAQAETFAPGCAGLRLLLPGEWLMPDAGGVGLRPPLSGLCFRLPEDLPGPWRLGLALRLPDAVDAGTANLRVLLNAATLWEGSVKAACWAELILNLDPAQLAPNGLNLLQCGMIPAGGVPGLMLRRLWVAPA